MCCFLSIFVLVEGVLAPSNYRFCSEKPNCLLVQNVFICAQPPFAFSQEQIWQNYKLVLAVCKMKYLKESLGMKAKIALALNSVMFFKSLILDPNYSFPLHARAHTFFGRKAYKYFSFLFTFSRTSFCWTQCTNSRCITCNKTE